MNEICYLFLEELTNKQEIINLNFGEFFQLYKNKTGKKGLSTFYGFLREHIALGRIKEEPKGNYIINLVKLQGLLNENR